MSRLIGEVEFKERIPRDRVVDAPESVQVLVSKAGVELVACPCVLDPNAAFELAGKLVEAWHASRKGEWA
jgi:hypothetical protein